METPPRGVILSVEDDPVDGVLVRDALAKWPQLSFRYEAAETLEQALGLLRKGPDAYAAILLDPNLPDSDGFDTLEAVCKAAPTTPVIVISDYGDDELSLQGCESGASAYFFKRDLNSSPAPRILACLLVAAARRPQTP